MRRCIVTPTNSRASDTYPISLSVIALAGLVGILAPVVLNAQSSTSTTVAHSVYWGEPLSNLLGGVASLLQDGFGAEDAKRVSETALQLSPNDFPASSQRHEAAFEHRVRFQNRTSGLKIRIVAVVDIGYVDVGFRSSDTALITAIHSVIWQSYLASLSSLERVRLTVRDEIWMQGKSPTLVLAMETVRQYGCLGFGIDHAFSRRDDTLQVELFGVSSPKGPCPAALGPALMRRQLHLASGQYTLAIGYHGAWDLFDLVLTDSSAALATERSSFVEADQRLWWRYPPRSFALYCQNVHVARTVCDDVEHWMGHQSGISSLQFSPQGVDPYRAGARNPDETVAFFRYTADRDLAGVRRCFAEIETVIGRVVGVALTVQTWTGVQITAWSGRSYDQPHITMPARVTAGPTCSQNP